MSDSLVDFMNTNKHLKLDITMRRNKHPFISFTYINGYIKDVSLRKMKPDQILKVMAQANTQCKVC